MRYCPKNSPLKDQGKVIVGLGVNLEQVYRTRKVPKTSASVVYNQLSELSQVGYKVSDDFDMMMIAKGFASINSGTGSSQDDGSKVINVSD